MEPMEVVRLKDSADYNEAWLQNEIANNASLMRLGKNLRVRDKERIQQHGRLDLLLEDSDADTPTRYEVEIQLGETDPSHIIRTIEYWDVESKRYPQYDHVAVLVAEEVTGRYLNVLQLFNRQIPIIVLKVEAFRIGGDVRLHFTKVLDRLQYGFEEEGIAEPADRSYWEKRSNKSMMKLTDELFEIVHSVDPVVTMNYVKHYVGLMREKVAKNYCYFDPKKSFVLMRCKVDDDAKRIEELEGEGLDVEYKPNYSELWLRFTSSPSEKQIDRIRDVIKLAKTDRI